MYHPAIFQQKNGIFQGVETHNFFKVLHCDIIRMSFMFFKGSISEQKTAAGTLAPVNLAPNIVTAVPAQEQGARLPARCHRRLDFSQNLVMSQFL